MSTRRKRPKVKYNSPPPPARKRGKPIGRNGWGVRKRTVLETMTVALATPGGATFRDIVSACRSKHPNRDPLSVANSVRTQLYRLPREHKGLAIVKKGNRYQLVPTSLK